MNTNKTPFFRTRSDPILSFVSRDVQYIRHHVFVCSRRAMWCGASCVSLSSSPVGGRRYFVAARWAERRPVVDTAYDTAGRPMGRAAADGRLQCPGDRSETNRRTTIITIIYDIIVLRYRRFRGPLGRPITARRPSNPRRRQ